MRRFAYDQIKNARNQLKHGVSFEEAENVFDDANALHAFDAEHSDEEDRFIVLGISVRLRVLFVVHTYLGADLIRILSARKATTREQQGYEAQLPFIP